MPQAGLGRAQMRSVFVFDKSQGKVVPINERKDRPTVDRSSPRGLQLIMDECDAFRNPVTGKMETSKSSYRRFLKEEGYEEIGNEMPQHSDHLKDHLGELKERGEWGN